ncbi:MAG: acyltransferase [Bacteroidia bacterium]|nr:acyltransferase [Bacteroidia bacterium]
MRNKLLHLEGLRGVAALMVVFCHIKNAYFVTFPDDLLESLKSSTGSYFVAHILHSFVNVLFDGNFAVYIFWFMSAYVISIGLFRTDGITYLKKSLIKRYFRLAIPVLGSVMLAWILLESGLLFNHKHALLAQKPYIDGWLGSLYNFHPSFFDALESGLWNAFFHYNEQRSYNGALWSMQPELFGSVFVLLLFGVIRLNRFRYSVYSLCIAFAFLMGWIWLISFILGFWLSDYENTSRPSNMLKKIFQFPALNYALLAGIIIIAGKPDFYNISDLILSTLLVLTIMYTDSLRNLFSMRIPVWLGNISFSLYLLHIPVICSLGSFLYIKFNLHNTIVMSCAIAAVLLTSILAAVLYTRYVDRNGIKWSGQIANFILTKLNGEKDSSI